MQNNNYNLKLQLQPWNEKYRPKTLNDIIINCYKYTNFNLNFNLNGL